MIDLIIKENGEGILNRDVKANEKITYQNEYLKSIQQIEYATVIEDLSRDSKLEAGCLANGKIVIIAHEGTNDYLVVKTI